MSEKIETVAPADTVVMPERPMDTPEVLENTPETPEVSPNAPEVPSEQAGPSELQMYQDVLAKHNEDSTYQMSDDEGEAFLNTQELIASGQIEDPGAAKIEEKPEETQETENSTETPATPGNEGEVTPEFRLSDDHANELHSSMSLVGAKDVSELAGKIKGLIDNMKSSGGQLGSEVKRLQAEKDNNVQWMNDLAAGKKEAFDYLDKITGGKTPPATTSTEAAPIVNGDFDPSKYLDDELATTVQGIMNSNKEMSERLDRLSKGDADRQALHNRESATNSWVDDVVGLVTDLPGDFGINPSEARALAADYWGPNGHTQAIHPKFQAMNDLIVYANEKGYPNLKSAHIMMQHENGGYAKKLIEATKKGQKSVTHKESPNSFISNAQRGSKANTPDPHIDDAAVNAMAKGDFNNIPDNWMDSSGTLIKGNIPKRFHKVAGF